MRVYIGVGGPLDGELIRSPEALPSYIHAEPLPAFYLDAETEPPTPRQAFREVRYHPDYISAIDDEGSRWTLHVLLEESLCSLGPYAKLRHCFAAALRHLSGVADVEPDVMPWMRRQRSDG